MQDIPAGVWKRCSTADKGLRSNCKTPESSVGGMNTKKVQSNTRFEGVGMGERAGFNHS